MHGVFISYGRRDDEPFVERLYADLAQHGVALWRDREAMRSRGRSFVQEIQDGIADFDRMLLVVGPFALDSEYCRMEWEFALARCRIVVPLFRRAGPEQLPPSLRSLQGYDFRVDDGYAKNLAALVADLREPVPPLAVLHDVIALPPMFLPRAAELQALCDVVAADAAASRVTVMHGMPGSGKTSLAAALARSCAIRRGFPGGVFWLALGHERDRPDVPPLQAAQAEGRVLLVLDDVWEKGQVEPVLKVLTERDRLLLTTRRSDFGVLFGAAARRVDALEDDAALELLARWARTPAERLDAAAVEVARECGNLPLSLAMTGALVAGGSSSWTEVLAQLRNANLAAIEHELQDYPQINLMRVMQVSVNALPTDADRARYLALAVFPEDRPFPATVLPLLWDRDAEPVPRNVALFVDRSLLQRDEAGRLSLHDLQRDYLRAVAGKGLPALHERLLEAYRRRDSNDWLELSDDGYFPDHLVYHVAGAGRIDELRELFDREGAASKPAWQLARSARDPSGGRFRADVGEWWRAAERIDREALRVGAAPTQLAVELRCALTAASLTAHAGRVSPKLLHALAAAGVWSIEAAEAAAWQMPDAHTIGAALGEIAPLLGLEALSKAFRWYLVAPHLSYAGWVMRAFVRRLATLGAVERAIALARRVGADLRDECDQTLIRAFIDAGKPREALEVMRGLPDPHRWQQICWDLAKCLDPALLPQLQTIVAGIADEPQSPYRSWIEATLAPRWLAAGETDLAAQAFAAIEQVDQRAECVGACGANAPADWVRAALRAALEAQVTWEWQTLAALHALAGPAFAVGIEAALVERLADASRLQDWFAQYPTRTVQLVFAVGLRLAGDAGERLRVRAAQMLASITDRATRSDCLRAIATECDEPERSACLRAAHAELERTGKPEDRCEWLLRSLDRLAEADRDPAVARLAEIVDALENGFERNEQAEALCNWCAAHDRLAEAWTLAQRFDRPGTHGRFRVLRAMAAVAPADELDALAVTIATLDEPSSRSIVPVEISDRSIVTKSLAARWLADGRVDAAIEAVARLPAEQRRSVWEELLPRLPRVRARQVAADLLQRFEPIEDSGGIESMQFALARRVHANGNLPLAIEVIGALRNATTRVYGLAFLAEDASAADRAALRSAADALAGAVEEERGTRASPPSPLAWSGLGLPDRALAALAAFDDEHERDWQRQTLITDPRSTLSADQAITLAGQIGDAELRRVATAGLWMRFADRRATLGVPAERWPQLWSTPEGRFAAATTVALAFGVPDAAETLEPPDRSKMLKTMLERATFVGHSWGSVERHLDAAFATDPLAPAAVAAFVGEAVLVAFDEGPLLPRRDAPRFAPALAWLCRRLTPQAATELATRVLTAEVEGDDDMQAFIRAQFLAVVVANGCPDDPAWFVEEIAALAGRMDDVFWSREPLYRVHPLLPALQRAELSTRAPSLLLYALGAENEEEEELWPFAAERFGPALLALDRQALHRAWSDLLHVLGTHERTTWWRLPDLLVGMLDKLGGDAALAACAAELQRVRRWWP